MPSGRKARLLRRITLVLVGACAIAILAGIHRDEVRVVVSNATILCYSCIGIK